MKKLVALLLAAIMVFTLAACSGNNETSSDPQNNNQGTTQPQNNNPPASGAEIVLVTNGPQSTIDDRGFNQLAWEGIQAYVAKSGKTANYYLPVEQSTASYIQCIDTAVKEGAKVVVTPGFLMAGAIYECQTTYPDVKFILIDSSPSSEETGEIYIAENTVAMSFAEDQSGFMAGYAAVYEGYTKLGFFGALAVPAVVRFGSGFAQGAEYAAKELGMAPGSVELLYTYTGSFDIAPEFQAKAASWYQTGTDCIFGCGSPDNVFAACESVGGNKVAIGVDTDMAENSETCLTSAMKMVAPAVEDALTKAYEGGWAGGTATIYDVTHNACGLPMETSRFKTFTQAQYDVLVDAMKQDKDGICTNMIVDVDANGNTVTIEDLAATLTYVSIKVVE